MEPQSSEADLQVKRIADSLERMERSYQEDRKRNDRYYVLSAFLNSIGIGVGIAMGVYIFLNK
jgi:hypothetical protein